MTSSTKKNRGPNMDLITCQYCRTILDKDRLGTMCPVCHNLLVASPEVKMEPPEEEWTKKLDDFITDETTLSSPISGEYYVQDLTKIKSFISRLLKVEYERGARNQAEMDAGAIREERQKAIKEAIDLSDEIELSVGTDSSIEEWKAFKRFRNTLRDRYGT